MSINAGTVYVDVRPDMSGFGTAVSSGVGTSVTSTTAKSSKLRSGLATFGKALAVPVVGGLVVGMAASINAASDFTESWSKVKQVFEENAKGIKAWSKDAAKSMGMSQQAALEAAGGLGAMLDAMGLNNKTTLDMSTSLVQLEADLGSFNNMPTAEVHTKIAAALTGEYEGMKSLGVVINEARVTREAERMGLIKHGETLKASQKAQVAYKLIMDDTTKAQGDFARTSDGMANKQKIMNAQFADTAAKLGKAVLPVVIQLMDWATRLISFITKNFPKGLKVIGDTVGGIIDFVVDSFNAAKGVLADLVNFVTQYVLNPIITGINTVIRGINLVKPGGDITPLNYIQAWQPSGQGPSGSGSYSDATSGGKDDVLGNPGRIVVEDHTTDGVTVREKHSQRMARNARPGGA